MRYFTVPGMGMFDVDGLEAGHPRVLLTRNTTRFRALNSRLDREGGNTCFFIWWWTASKTDES